MWLTSHRDTPPAVLSERTTAGRSSVSRDLGTFISFFPFPLNFPFFYSTHYSLLTHPTTHPLRMTRSQPTSTTSQLPATTTTTMTTPTLTTKKKTVRIVVLAGDNIGPEVTKEAVRVLDVVAGLTANRHHLDFEFVHGLVGGAAIDAHGRSPPHPVSQPVSLH